MDACDVVTGSSSPLPRSDPRLSLLGKWEAGEQPNIGLIKEVSLGWNDSFSLHLHLIAYATIYDLQVRAAKSPSPIFWTLGTGTRGHVMPIRPRKAAALDTNRM